MPGRRSGRGWSLFRQDLVLAYRNGLVLASAVMSVLFIVLVDLVIPKEVKLSAKEYVVDLTEGSVVAQYLGSSASRVTLLDTERQLLDRLEAEKMSVGVVFSGSRSEPAATVYLQGDEPPSSVRALDVVLAGLWNVASGAEAPGYSRVELLRPETVKPAFNKTMVPVILATEVTMLGYLFVAVMVFQEKAEGSIRAYRVSPGGVWAYIGSKVASNTLLTVGYGAVIIAFTIGLSARTLPVLGLVGVAGVLLSAVGLTLSVFFEDLSGFLYPAMLLFMLFGLPVTIYFFPALTIPGLELIPSYPLAFGIREILFPTGKTGFYLPMILTLAGEALVLLLVCYRAVDRRLMKEAG